MRRSFALILCALPLVTGYAQQINKETEMIRYEDYVYLADQVKGVRKDRLLSLDQFNEYALGPNTVILDTRSDSMYNAKHIAGAIHLNFSDFNAENLAQLIPNRNTRILIYCNNNFLKDAQLAVDDRYFPSKVSSPLPIEPVFPLIQEGKNPNNTRSRSGYALNELTEVEDPLEAVLTKQYTLALNIPTFISLYGYGYHNVYELGELIETTDARLVLEGTAVENTSRLMTLPIQPAFTTSYLVNFDDYTQLMAEVKAHRESHLVDLNNFNTLSAQPNTIILDFRSQVMYDAMHVKGAIHLDFTEFTQETLDSLIPDKSMNVLIYCNNNFVTDLLQMQSPKYFQSKKAMPEEMNYYRKLTLALNVPAYINLYGYGFKNVYELAETVAISDPRIQFEGTSVK